MTNITTPRLGQWVNNMALVPRPHNYGTTFLGSGIHTATVPVAGPGFRGDPRNTVGYAFHQNEDSNSRDQINNSKNLIVAQTDNPTHSYSGSYKRKPNRS